MRAFLSRLAVESQKQHEAEGFLTAPSSVVSPPESGQSSGMRSGGEPAAYGDAPSVAGAISAALGGGLLGSSLGKVGSQAVGYGLGTLGLGPLGMAMTGWGAMTALGNAIRGWSGAPEFEANPLAGAPSLADIQSAYDYGGYFSGLAAQQAREDANRSFYGINNPIGFDLTAEHAAPSIGNPDSPFGNSPSGSNAGGSMGGGFGQGSSTGSGEGRSDSGDTSSKAKGGVEYAASPKTVTFGDTPKAGEYAFFLPEDFFRKGVQSPQELQLRRAMMWALTKLRG
jgi:hypothetical protein